MFQLLVGNVGKIVQLWNFVLMEIGYLSKNYLISVKYNGLYLYLRESEIDYFRYCKTVTFFLRFSNLFARFEWIAQIFSRFKRLLKTLYNQLLSFQNFKRLIF